MGEFPRGGMNYVVLVLGVLLLFLYVSCIVGWVSWEGKLGISFGKSHIGLDISKYVNSMILTVRFDMQCETSYFKNKLLCARKVLIAP